MKKLTLSLAVITLIACATPAVSMDAPETEISAAEEASLTQSVERYLNSLSTLQSTFTQTAADGTLVSGTFYLKRPGRLRFEYDAPIEDYIVADGLFIHYWDAELEEHNNAPIGSTLADFLLTEKIKLSGDLTVSDIRELNNGKISVTLRQTEDPNAGKLALMLSQNPMQLEKWRIVDPTGAMTEVALNNIQTGQKLPATLFVFKPPAGYVDPIDER